MTDFRQPKRDASADLPPSPEELLRGRRAGAGTGTLTPQEIQDLVDELDRHRNELETQNRELRAAQRELEKSRDRYARLYDSAPVGYISHDASGLIAQANLTAARILGTARSQLIGWPLGPYVAAEHQQRFLAHLHRCGSGSSPRSCELFLRSNDGELVPVRLDTSRSDDDREATFYTTIINVTEQKRAERALEESRRRLSRVVQASNDGIWEWPDLSEHEYWWSPRFYEILGYEDGEFTPTLDRFAELLHPDDRDRVISEILQRIEQQGPFEDEYRLRAKSGNYVWVQARGQTFRDAAGNALTMYGAAQDVTARKRTEEALRESRERFKTLADTLPQTVYECDADGRLIYVNRRAFEMFGYTAEDFEKGLYAAEMLAPEERARGTRMIAEAMAGNTAPSGREYVARRKDGSTFPVVIYSSPIARGGKAAGLRGIIVDLTQQKVAEKQLREREAQLAHMSRLHTVGAMAGALAHELNQPLYAINNYVRGARRRLARQVLSPELETLVDVMDRVSKEVDRAAGIISHLRAFVRGREPRRTSVDLAQLLKQAADLLGPVARDRGVAFQFDVAGDLPMVQADRIQVEQVVVNLVANAIDAAAELPEERRKVTIVGRRAEKGGVEITVRDLGPGVPKALEEKLFEAFVTSKDEGLGMGLAISRSIVHAHGGKIWVAHNQPHGAAFHFTLPASTADTG